MTLKQHARRIKRATNHTKTLGIQKTVDFLAAQASASRAKKAENKFVTVQMEKLGYVRTAKAMLKGEKMGDVFTSSDFKRAPKKKA